ncbi:MAG: hypothetical protein RLZ10_437 [Bacteroidota bacterium]|jgi:hypothetical protein
MKKFFNSMEERFVFPIGRRTWQVSSLLALIVLFSSIVYFLINSTPTGKDSVSVSKNEVVENRIDTTSTAPVQELSCSINEYAAWIDTLKKDLPNSEWINLGDSSEPYSDYVLDENGNYQEVFKRNFNENPSAIPNILKIIYSSKGLDLNDSSDICEKVDLLKSLHALNGFHDPIFLTQQGFFYNSQLVSNYNVTTYSIDQTQTLFNSIENRNIKIADDKSYQQMMRYLIYVIQNNLSSIKIDLVKSILSAHRDLKNAKYPKEDYFDIAEVIFDTDVTDEDLSPAINDFNEDISFYDQNNLKSSLKRYLKIYKEKLERAEEDQARRKAEKEANRGLSLMSAGGAFISIVSIATILLLFSIQSLLKGYIVKKG